MKRARDWAFSNSSVEQKTATLRNKLSILNARKDDVCKELEYDEIQPGKKRREEVHHWLTAVQVKFTDGHGKGSSSNSQDTGWLERSIEEIDELIRRGNFSNGLVLSDHEGTRLPLLVEKKLVGQKLQQNTDKILGWLQNHKHNIMGIYGMGGVGKSTLLMKVHNLLLQDSNVYGRVYWVTVSQNCSAHKLQEDIAKALGVDSLGDDGVRKRAAMLHSKLAANGPTILILDDMWESFLGTEVGIPLSSSCKIILSTRSLEVCRRMGCKELIIKAEILSEKEAWELFVDKLGHYDTLSSEAKDIAKNVAQECGGLPLAIATVARSMSGIVDIYDWRNALIELQSVCRTDGMNDDVLPKLQFSYDRLNNKMVQHCFLSCILYPEDWDISRVTLIRLWIDEGLLDEIESRGAQVVKGHAILNKLENWCLLESTLDRRGKKSVKMHDLIRDMAIMITKDRPRFIAKSRQHLDKLPKEKQWSEDLVKVSLSWNDIVEIPCDMAPFTPQLTVLMLNENPLKVIPESFFKHMTALTVLDLSCTSIERLPESVSDLVNLRALLLSFCKHLIYVPSLVKLSKLRVLDLERDKMLVAAPKGIERLKCLEKVTYCLWDVSDISRFNKLIHSSPPLSSYRFWLIDSPRFVPGLFLFSDVRYWGFFDHDTSYDYEKVMWISGVGYGEDEASPLIPTSVQYLVIYDSDMKGISLGALTDLLCVKLIKCRGLEYISSSSSSSGSHQGSSICPQLETLEKLWLRDLPDLRRIIKSGDCSFSELEELKIMKCPKIKVVLPLTGDQLCLPNLTSIWVEDCEEVEDIFESNDSIQPNPIITFPKLEKLRLSNLPKLGKTYRGSPNGESLRSVNIRKCRGLEYILSSSSSSGTHQGSSICPQLETLEKLNLEDLPDLRRIIKSGGCSFSNLRDLTILNCPKIKVVLPLTGDQLCLPNLESIEVEDCEEVEDIFESNDSIEPNPILTFPKLQKLRLCNLPKLGKTYRGLLNGESLRSVKIRECRGLEYISSSSSSSGIHQGSSICPQLETLEKLNLEDLPDLRRIIKSGGCSFSNLGDLTITKCPKIKVVLPLTGDQLCLPNLTYIEVEDCEEVEDIFESNDSIEPNPILTFPKLQEMELYNLPKLGRIYRGLLICESLLSSDAAVVLRDVPKLKLLPLSSALICDASPSTLNSIAGNTEMWEMLHRDYPKDAITLSDHINKPPQPASLANADSPWRRGK